MRKLLQYLDNHILIWSVIFTSLFIVLYPKLPSIHITHTWVYIRLEDFVIGAISVLWVIQVLRRKVKLPIALGIPIVLYWVVGLASLVYLLKYIGPSLANFFPSVAVLEYFRRIEYMILFFVGFASIQSKQNLKLFIRFLFFGVAAIVMYGLAQHFYPYFWKYLPVFLQKTNFCFPSFQTGNEEFAKGIPLCLPVGSRVTSTFGGHYDLAGYLLITLPIVLGVWFIVKKRLTKILLGALFITGLITLILTSSRIAFVAYLFAIVMPLILLKKKKWIAPVLLLSFACLVLFSESTIHRFAQTFRLTTVVVNMQGQVVGTTENGLTSEQVKQLSQGKNAIQENQVIQGAVPEGSSFITLPQQKVATTTAVISKGLTTKQAQQLQLANGGLEISTVKGNFSIQKALVYDISVTTRLQGEWPNALKALITYPLLGKGYSTLSLAVDNDFLRLLGESGILGFMSFVCIFLIFGIFLRQILPQVDDPLTKIFLYGLCGGVVGLIINATLFDIFEASKVAEPLWLMLGIGAGVASLYQKKKIAYFTSLYKVITAKVFLAVYLFIVTVGLFWQSINNFFIGDDFVWLKWAATSTFTDMPKYFTDAGGFFYRPLDKLLMLIFYSVFSFQPQGYHTVILILVFLMSLGVYDLVHELFGRKLWAFIGALLFILLPMHGENIFWISSLSIDLSSVCLLFMTILFIKSMKYNNWKSPVRYVGSVVLATLSLLSYELALISPVLLFVSDFILNKKMTRRKLLLYIPFVILDVMYLLMRLVSHAFSMGGDYAYSLPHFIPNAVGNTIGYVGLFIFGQWSLPFYNILRTNTKMFALPIGLLLLVIIVGLLFYFRKTDWRVLLKKYPLPLYGLAFSLVALLPYFGLGNIAQRYGYLSSVGFIILVIWVAQFISQKLNTKERMKYILAILVGGLVTVYCVMGLMRAASDWTMASKITYKTLGYFKIEYPNVLSKTTFIIVNRPITYKDAWVFPVGFAEGLWFVYGDQAPQIQDVSSVDQAKKLLSTTSHSYAFAFDKNYSISKVK